MYSLLTLSTLWTILLVFLFTCITLSTNYYLLSLDLNLLLDSITEWLPYYYDTTILSLLYVYTLVYCRLVRVLLVDELSIGRKCLFLLYCKYDEGYPHLRTTSLAILSITIGYSYYNYGLLLIDGVYLDNWLFNCCIRVL